ncbi:MAG: nicotinate (nicotinamide) nucleotide adenylyltransferase [Patescibacteria group bacterium]|nr:nicotinate (nicotinamide) nucleotide adenylyltransferase [Patescibacteria group bacterium]
MNITLFGGSFNPPHLGHQIVLAQAFELIPHLDQIWLLPEYQHSFAKNTHLAPVKHRLAMVKLFENLSTNRRIKLQTCCLDQKMSGNTIEHITYLKAKFPQHKFSFLMGSDNLTNFHLWPEYRTLLKLIPFYVYPRANYPFKSLYPNMYLLQHPLQIITNISSTMIRLRLKKKLNINHLVPPPIANYFTKNSLF